MAGHVGHRDLPSSKPGSVSTTDAVAPSQQDRSNAQERTENVRTDESKVESRQVTQTPASTTAPKKTALSFDVYTNICRGMSVQEVLVKVDTPTNEEFAPSNSLCLRRQLMGLGSTPPTGRVKQRRRGVLRRYRRRCKAFQVKRFRTIYGELRKSSAQMIAA